jgi:hypothetical protein
MKKTREQIQAALDSLNEGILGSRKDYQWDNSMRMQSDLNIAKSKEAREKMAVAAKVRHKDGWASPSRYEWTVENNPNKGGNKGKKNPVYGRGARYLEHTTGFTGAFLDMKNQFPGFTIQLVGRKNIQKNSIFPKCKWTKIADTSMKIKPKKVHLTIEQVLEIKENYKKDITMSASSISNNYNVHLVAINNMLSNKDVYNDPKFGPPVEVRSHPIHTCPHCSKQVGGSNFKRWHGDNCKNKVVE